MRLYIEEKYFVALCNMNRLDIKISAVAFFVLMYVNACHILYIKIENAEK